MSGLNVEAVLGNVATFVKVLGGPVDDVPVEPPDHFLREALELIPLHDCRCEESKWVRPGETCSDDFYRCTPRTPTIYDKEEQ